MRPFTSARNRPETGASPVTIGAEIRAAYLYRLDLDAEPPSVDALQRLHRGHVEKVPYETLWIHEGDTWGIDPADSAARIALQGRGGYCFHLNGAFSELLRSLGYAVTRHVGGVHGPAGPDEGPLGNHLVLWVHGHELADRRGRHGRLRRAARVAVDVS